MRRRYNKLIDIDYANLLYLRSIVDELKPDFAQSAGSREPECVSLAWSADGQTLFGGFTDDLVRVWAVSS